MSETMHLVVIPAANLPTILAADDKDIFGKLVKELADFVPDASSPQGREEIGSKASKVGKAKMDLVRLANGLTEDWRKQTAAVVAERKIIETRMDELRRQIEAPRDEYNAIEKRRVEGHEAALGEFETFQFPAEEGSSKTIAKLIDALDALYPDRDWEEFAGKAKTARINAFNALRVAFQETRTREDEAEAARIAAAKQAEREREAAVLAQIAREERILAEATERAKVEAEAEAERRAQRVDYHRRMLQHVKNCGFGFIDEQPQPYGILQYELTDKIKYTEDNFGDWLPQALIARDEALKSIQRGIDAAMRRAKEEESRLAAERKNAEALARVEREKQEAIDKAERDRLASIERERVIKERERLSAEQAEAAKEAAARQAERDQLAAVEAERKRVAAEAERQRIVDEERAANRAHRANINRAALAGIMAVLNDHWQDEDAGPDTLARHLVTALARGEVDYVKVQY
jgi:hypothetical protein